VLIPKKGFSKNGQSSTNGTAEEGGDE
jgi:hypothetical protein